MSPDLSNNGSLNHRYLIKNAYAILTGLSGDAARSSFTDIRIQDGKIIELGQLTAQSNEQIIDAKDCVIYPAWVNTHHQFISILIEGRTARFKSKPNLLACQYAIPISWCIR